MMTRDKSMLLLLIPLFGMLVLVAGCEDQLLIECNYDSDCIGDEHCIEGYCSPACSSDDECSPGMQCEAYQRDRDPDPVHYCTEPAGANDQDGGGYDAGFDDAYGDEDVTEQDDADDAEPASILVVEQLDADGEPLSTGDDDGGPDGDDDPDNADEEPGIVRLGAVAVRDETDSAAGFGRVTSLDGDDADQYGDLPGPHLPLVDDGTCVEEPATAPYAELGGPGSRAFLELLDESSRPVDIDDGWRIDVVAAGTECPIAVSGDAIDSFVAGHYRAHLCETDGGDELPDLDDCDHHWQGPLTSFGKLEVTGE